MTDRPKSTPPVTTSRAVVPVPPHRLAFGEWCHERQRTVGEGDIRASYSADVIALENRVRRSFEYRNQQWVLIGSYGHSGDSGHTAYRLLPLEVFGTSATTYSEKTSPDAAAARADPHGFYHAMTVARGGRSFVLTGPPVTFVAGDPAPRQLDLF